MLAAPSELCGQTLVLCGPRRWPEVPSVEGALTGAPLRGRWRELAAVPCLRASQQSTWDGGKLRTDSFERPPCSPSVGHSPCLGGLQVSLVLGTVI